MQTKDNFFTESKRSVKEYIHQKILLIKLQLVEKVSHLVASIISAFIIAVLSFFILLCLSIMAGFYFASLTDSNYIGFGIITGIYVILLFIILALRKNTINRAIINSIIKTMLDKTPDHDADNDTSK